MSNLSAGQSLRAALELEHPLQIVGAVSAYAAMLAARAGFRALYLSGAGVANSAFGLPDLGVTTLNDVTEEVRRITAACTLPLLVDADTGFGGAFSIARTCRELARAGVAGLHLEDQVQSKRCGHRPGKQLVSAAEMCDRLKAALEGPQAYVAGGGDMIFAGALTTLAEFRQFTAAVPVPVLANIAEFGRT